MANNNAKHIKAARKTAPERKASVAPEARRKAPAPDVFDVTPDEDLEPEVPMFGGLGFGALAGLPTSISEDKESIMLLQHLQSHVKKRMADRTAKIDKAFNDGTKEAMEKFGTFTSALESGIDAQIGQMKGKLEDIEEDTSVLIKRQRIEYEKCQTVSQGVVEAMERNHANIVKTVRAFEKEMQELQLAQQSELAGYQQEVNKAIAGFKATANSLAKESKTNDKMKQSLLQMLSI